MEEKESMTCTRWHNFYRKEEIWGEKRDEVYGKKCERERQKDTWGS